MCAATCDLIYLYFQGVDLDDTSPVAETDDDSFDRSSVVSVHDMTLLEHEGFKLIGKRRLASVSELKAKGLPITGSDFVRLGSTHFQNGLTLVRRLSCTDGLEYASLVMTQDAIGSSSNQASVQLSTPVLSKRSTMFQRIGNECTSDCCLPLFVMSL